MKADILTCPVCAQPLVRVEHSYLCPNRHTFDIARSGYVNLYRSNSSGHHGDDKKMILARTAFLNRGYYDALADAVAARAAELCPEGGVVLDAGCGEGKYTVSVWNALQSAGKSADVVGADISKAAAEALAKRSKGILSLVASTADLPLRDQSADVVLNLFSPFFGEEFLRVLKPDGYLLRVVPLEDHLWELKKAIYDRPYKNEVPSYEEAGFRILEKRELRSRIHIEGNDDIQALFCMTPYYYKTGREDQEKCSRLTELDVTIAFLIILYKKEEETREV